MLNKIARALPDDTGDLFKVKSLMSELVSQTELLIDVIAKQQPYFIGYQIERISKAQEKTCIVEGIQHLSVKPLTQWTELHGVLQSWQDFYAPLTASTKFVYRLPGFVIVNEEKDTVLALVTAINDLKDRIANTVRHNRDKHQRHDFIHSAFAGLMTEQLYRKIQIKDEHVNNVWFNWVSRPVPKTFTIEEAIVYIESKKNKPPIEFSITEWQARLAITLNKVASGRFQKIQKLKQFRLLPTIEFNLIQEGQKKRNKHNATTPFILLGQVNNVNPSFTALTDFSKADKAKKTAFIDRNKELIDSFLQLVGVR